jgi:general secretion pathway protein J
MRRSERGFTIVELLVSLAILGLMSVMLLSGVTTGRRVWDKVEARGSEADTIASASAQVRTLIETAFPETLFSTGDPSVAFAGNTLGMTFLAAPPAGTASGPAEYRLGTDASGALTLVRAGAATPLRLLDGVRATEFAYFGAAAPDNERRWRGAWREQPRLPELVRVRLGFAPGDRRVWPDLVAHPAATLDYACVTDLASGDCRGR